MRKLFAVAVMAAALTALVDCSGSQLASINAKLDIFDSSIDNFNAAAARIDTTIAKTSATLAQYCAAAKTTGGNLVPLVQNSDAARTGLATVTGGLNQYCASVPVDIGSAVSSMAAIVASGKAAYDAARKGG